MRVICGDRNWKDRTVIEAALRWLDQTTMVGEEHVVIHGAARGADTIAGEVAAALGMKVERYPADWNKYGRAAGPIRNQQMLDEGKPDEVWAFHSDIKNSKGTRDMARRARKAKLPVEVYTDRTSLPIRYET